MTSPTPADPSSKAAARSKRQRSTPPSSPRHTVLPPSPTKSPDVRKPPRKRPIAESKINAGSNDALQPAGPDIVLTPRKQRNLRQLVLTARDTYLQFSEFWDSLGLPSVDSDWDEDLDEADEYQEDFAATGVIENDQDTTEVVNKEGKADNEEHCEDEPPEENDERGVGNEDERVAEEENDSADETASVDNAEGTGPSTAPVPRQFRIPDLSLPAPHVRCLIEILNSLIDGTCEVNRKDALVRWKFDFEVLDTIADFANLKHTPSAVSLPVPRSKMTAAFKGGLTVGVLLTDLEGGNLWNAAPLRADKIRVTIKSVQTDKIYFTYIESDLPSTAYNQWWFFLMFLDVAARYKADEEGLQKVRKRAESKAAGQALARALPYKNGKLKGRPA
ncbi:hypothetical protein A1Q1_00386 [Trichosporon asahii var. asahii CBS 2479]|uniref:Uncharacterized protein n=1 Tax=Trichosporon asahii var. asahii (strain ATCC 90039 / CBS 2479 / JCM 2466 / KCTC 7840 / NBRC 103889/ NCYC 2677 / UAMH 7654) TaxID=1186058 RepID=J5TCZ0_TRIAS|nr:hypothetical protein A1Q1_00386 [Trichosporon asahii var. asahii CBS 2479]EJT50331.1 hypothetical protein A1Q1_00386 [Trichosporon asahii var. asahii CBS 2479]